MNTYFSEESRIDEAVYNRIAGSLAFRPNRQLFYSPMAQDINHELLHALHNSRGTNRSNSQFDNEWGNAEEFWITEGGKTSENSLCQMANGQVRLGP